MKIKNCFVAVLFVALMGSALAQQYRTDVVIDGFVGRIAKVDQKMYEAKVSGGEMQRGTLLEHLQTVYSSKGHRKNMTFLSTGEDNVIFRTRYKHDGFGLVTLEQIVDPAENVVGRTYYVYNQNNILSETYVEDAERQVENRVRYYYDNTGRLSQRSYNDPLNEIYKREVYTYDNNGDIARTVVFDRNKKKMQEWRYEYDEHHQPVSQTLYDYTEDEPEVFLTLFRYQYDDNGNWIQKVEYTLDNDRTTPVFITERYMEYFK
ncbi:MAG: hypothetical protein MJZ81_04625 [Bacteroidales bacterium]|nr:hypothetical protein [Bacteroidales bacterium]